MKHAFLLVLSFVGILRAETVSNVTLRQDWPWSGRMTVNYTLSDVTNTVNIGVEAYVGTGRLDTIGLALSGDVTALATNGTYALSFDVADLADNGWKYVSDFKVKVFPVACDPTYFVPLYKVYNLADGTCEDVTPAKILSGGYGSYQWIGGTPVYVPGGPIPYTNLVWTGVNEDGKYKTTHLAMRYFAAKGDTYYILGYTSNAFQHDHDFYAAVFETTQAQWTNVYKSAAACGFLGDTRPVETITYDIVRGAKGGAGEEAKFYWPNNPDTNSFLGKLRTLTQVNFDLPTGNEWTYACQARSGFYGTPATWSDNTPFKSTVAGVTVTNPPPARYGASSTAVVGSFNPNMQGLYDVQGNVYEMCVDWSFRLQSYWRDTVKTNANVKLADPTKDYEGVTGTSRNSMGGCYSTTIASMTLNSAGRNATTPSSGSKTVGFRVFMPSSFAVGEATVLDAATPGESAAGAVYLKPDETYLWRTAPSGDFTVTWVFPAGATKATLTVAGGGFYEIHADLTTTSQALSLPAAADDASENVYDLTLVFNDAAVTEKTAKLGRIRGAVTGGAATVRYVPEGSRFWSLAARRNVLPNLPGASSFRVGGIETVTGLGAAAGWFLWKCSSTTATELRLTADADQYTAMLALPVGTLISFR